MKILAILLSLILLTFAHAQIVRPTGGGQFVFDSDTTKIPAQVEQYLAEILPKQYKKCTAKTIAVYSIIDVYSILKIAFGNETMGNLEKIKALEIKAESEECLESIKDKNSLELNCLLSDDMRELLRVFVENEAMSRDWLSKKYSLTDKEKTKMLDFFKDLSEVKIKVSEKKKTDRSQQKSPPRTEE